MGDAHETASEATMSNEHAELERLRAEVERLRRRVHEVADEQQRRFAPYVSRCDQFDVLAAIARRHCGVTTDARGGEQRAWDMASSIVRNFALAESERADAAERALSGLRARVEALIDQWDGEIGAQEDYQSAAGIRAVEACMRDLITALAEPTTEGRA